MAIELAATLGVALDDKKFQYIVTDKQQLYIKMKPADEAFSKLKMPDIPKPDLGKRTLADICKEYDLDINTIMQGLGDNSIKAKPDMSMKKIADENSVSPIDIYDIIKKLA